MRTFNPRCDLVLAVWRWTVGNERERAERDKDARAAVAAIRAERGAAYDLEPLAFRRLGELVEAGLGQADRLETESALDYALEMIRVLRERALPQPEASPVRARRGGAREKIPAAEPAPDAAPAADPADSWRHRADIA